MRSHEPLDEAERRERATNANGGRTSNSPLFIREGDAFAKEYKPLEYVVDEILPKGTLITITGPAR